MVKPRTFILASIYVRLLDVDLQLVAEKRFVVLLRMVTMQPITAESADEDEEADGYVFFVDSKDEIGGLFRKEIVQSWREDPDPRYG